jgi:hypothetical protein
VIVSRRGQGLVLVRQVDHQHQCALMAEAWGNGGFARPEPFAPIATAAACHDEGWRTWEARPRSRSGVPVDFTEIDRPSHVALYREGIRAAVDRGPRVGLLVSMHGQRLYEGRQNSEPVVRDFLREQETLQRDLRRTIGEDPELAAWSAAASRLVRTWDSLSIHLLWRGLLTGCDLTLPRVPREAGDSGLDLRVSPDGPLACLISPWPFQGDELALPVRDPDDRAAALYVRPRPPGEPREGALGDPRLQGEAGVTSARPAPGARRRRWAGQSSWYLKETDRRLRN